MRRNLTLTVHGSPAPMGSRIAGVRKDGTRFTRPASKRGVAWKETVAETAAAEGASMDPPYSIECFFLEERPAKPSYAWPVKGDIDKLVRGTLDGLKIGGVITDDRHVVSLTATRNWTTEDPRALVSIRSLAHAYEEAA